MFIVCAGDKTPLKIKIVSNAIWVWMSEKVDSRNETGWLEPNTMMVYLRTMLGDMNEVYSWNYNLMKDFNFKGGLTPALNDFFTTHHNKDKKYGTEPKKVVMKGAHCFTDLDLSIFDERDIWDHQMKIQLIYGGLTGFRGSREHALFELPHVKRDVYEPDHPLAGQEYWGLQPRQYKNHQMTTANPILEEYTHGRIPCGDINDPASPGGCIGRYMEKISPGQERIYCYEATKSEKNRFPQVG